MNTWRLHLARVTGSTIGQIAIALNSRLAAAGAQFLLYISVARLLPLEEAGTFFLAISMVAVASAVSRAGFDQILMRVISERLVKDNLIETRAIALGSYLRVAMTALVASPLLIVVGSVLASHGGSPLLNRALPSTTVGLCGLTVAVVGGEVLKAASKPAIGLFIAYGLGPLLTTAFLVMMGPRLSLPTAGWSYSLGMSIAAAIAILATVNRFPAAPAKKANVDWKAISTSRRPLIAAAIGALLINWFPLLYLGVVSSAQDVALFSVGLRLANLVGFVIIASNAVIGPRLARLWASGRTSELRALIRSATTVTIGVCMTVAVLMSIGSEFLLGLFGPAYLAAQSEVKVLIFAQLVSAAASPISLALIGMGAERSYRIGAVAGAVSAVLLSLMFINAYGAIGSAMATLGAFTVQAGGWILSYRALIRRNMRG